MKRVLLSASIFILFLATHYSFCSTQEKEIFSGQEKELRSWEDDELNVTQDEQELLPPKEELRITPYENKKNLWWQKLTQCNNSDSFIKNQECFKFLRRVRMLNKGDDLYVFFLKKMIEKYCTLWERTRIQI